MAFFKPITPTKIVSNLASKEQAAEINLNWNETVFLKTVMLAANMK